MHVFHKWYVIAVQQTQYVHLGGGDVTGVLYACAKCSEFKVEKLSGHWTLEQLKGAPSSYSAP